MEVALGGLIIAACFTLGITMQGANWTFPYFSVVENGVSQGHWAISKSDYYAFISLSHFDKIWFDFSAAKNAQNLVPFNYCAEALLHVIIFSKLLLPFIPPILALVTLQVIIHWIVCIAVIRRFSEKYLRLLFIAFYAVNPVVLKFVCFPFYYFWQVLPSVFLVLYLLDRRSWGIYLLPVALILGFSIGMRGTTILVVVAFLLLSIWKERSAISLLSVALVLVVKVFIYNGDASPWHTMYVGIGGYDNPYGLTLSDVEGYRLFEKETGVVISTDVISGNYYHSETRSDYFNVLKEGYLNILKQSPLLLVSNAIKNTLGGYSFGYFVGNPLLQWVAIISGGGFALMLLFLRQYAWFLAIGFSLITFTSFYPPIPAYMYGSYLILVVAFLQMLTPPNRIIQKSLISDRLDNE
ncbi:hypothetical protein N9U06_00310 [Gammaproteobacteria bacterium]|nr:hypothetical protein [Gammaproteobacteria bacterium]